MSKYRPEFESALRVLAAIGKSFKARGINPPVLVGGGAVEFYTMSAITSSDFDLVGAYEETLFDALREAGLERYKVKNALIKYWVHKDTDIAIEFVGSRLMDGHTNRSYIQTVTIGEGDNQEVLILPVEDLIADRLAQYDSDNNCLDMLKQAQLLWKVASEIDLVYIDKRINDEAPSLDWEDLLGERDEAYNT